MFLWYAYQAEVQVYGAGRTWTAQTCSAVGGRACTFDEFLRHIQRVGRNTGAWPGSTTVGNAVAPGVVDTAERLRFQWDYTPNLDPHNVMPSTIPYGASPAFEDLFKHSVEGLKQAAADAPNARVDIRAMIDGAQEAMECVHAMRKADFHEGMVRTLTGYLRGEGLAPANFVVVKKSPPPMLLPNGDPYDEIDIARTLAANQANPQTNAALEGAIRKYLTQVDDASVNLGEANHQKALSLTQGWASELAALPRTPVCAT